MLLPIKITPEAPRAATAPHSTLRAVVSEPAVPRSS